MRLEGVKLKLDTLLTSHNLAEKIPGPELAKLGQVLVSNTNKDLQARSDWDTRLAGAIGFVMQVQDKKNAPFTGASNIKFPLMTVAALNYHSRAYPALVQGNDLVTMRPVCYDPKGELTKIGERVAKHMSYQLLDEQTDWEEDQDRLFLAQAIMGCVFKKVRWDSTDDMVRSELVYPHHLVVPYYTRRLKDAQRIAHIIPMTANTLHERVAMGVFLEDDPNHETAPSPVPALTKVDEKTRELQGVQPNGDDEYSPKTFFEIHTGLDLDQDGYCEPYCITVDALTGYVRRIVAMFYESDITWSPVHKNRIARIKPDCPFVKYPFIPSPDGGFYDMGFWSLLLPVNAGVNTAVNQLIDAATKQNSGGGFLGRGVKLSGGRTRVEPGEWIRAESSGPQLRDNIVPHIHAEPSQSLLQLAQLLIGYGEKVGMSTELATGENIGQNTPAQTANTMSEGGLNVFNGVYKRTWRAMGDELRAIFRVNKRHLAGSPAFEELVAGGAMDISVKDYFAARGVVRPAADPHVATDHTRVQQANLVVQLSAQGPGFDDYQAKKRLLQAMKVANIEEVLPDPNGPNALPPQAPPPQVQAAELRAKTVVLKVKVQTQLRALQLTQAAEKNHAQIALLNAQTIKALAEADATGDRSRLDALTARMEALRGANELVIKTAEMAHELASGMDEGGADTQETPGYDIGPAVLAAGLGNVVPPPDDSGGDGLGGGEAFGPPAIVGRGRPVELGI